MADYQITTHGTVVMIAPSTDAAREHADEAFGEDALRYAGQIACEPRYLGDVVAGLLDEGFTVTINGEEIASVEAA